MYKHRFLVKLFTIFYVFFFLHSHVTIDHNITNKKKNSKHMGYGEWTWAKQKETTAQRVKGRCWNWDTHHQLWIYDFCYSKIQGEKPLLVSTFSGNSYFSSYILFLPFLVPILKNVSCFGLYCYIKNGKSWRDKRQE